VISNKVSVPIDAISNKLIILNPESKLEHKNAKIQHVRIKEGLPRMTILSEKYDATVIRRVIHPIIRGELGTNNAMPIPTKSHKNRGRIRC